MCQGGSPWRVGELARSEFGDTAFPCVEVGNSAQSEEYLPGHEYLIRSSIGPLLCFVVYESARGSLNGGFLQTRREIAINPRCTCNVGIEILSTFLPFRYIPNSSQLQCHKHLIVVTTSWMCILVGGRFYSISNDGIG